MAAWLSEIILTLLFSGHYVDVALRNFGLPLGALALRMPRFDDFCCTSIAKRRGYNGSRHASPTRMTTLITVSEYEFTETAEPFDKEADSPFMPEPASKRSRFRSFASLAMVAGLSLAAAAIGGRIASKRTNKGWYRLLQKPSFTPRDRIFSRVWPVLYTLDAISAWRIARAPSSRERTRALGLWGAQLAFNAAWTPLFFGAHRPLSAMADLLGNYATLTAYAVTARKVDKTAARMVIPYLGWLTFAGALNAAIAVKNRRGIMNWMARR